MGARVQSEDINAELAVNPQCLLFTQGIRIVFCDVLNLCRELNAVSKDALTTHKMKKRQSMKQVIFHIYQTTVKLNTRVDEAVPSVHPFSTITCTPG